MDPVQDHLATVLTEKFDIDPDAISPEATPTELGLDSLAAVELGDTLQEHWGIDDLGFAEDAPLGDAALDTIAGAVRRRLREQNGAGEPGARR